jgi:hypothetical protein
VKDNTKNQSREQYDLDESAKRQYGQADFWSEKNIFHKVENVLTAASL